jgi:hypothetical protein
MDALSRLAQGADAPRPPETLLVDSPVDQDFDDFLDLFADLRGLVPSSFFLLFKIARIVKSPDGKLGGQLKGFFDICLSADRRTAVDSPSKKSLAENVPVLTGHDPHFGERRIKGVEEVGAIKPGDVATEDFTELLRKAEEQQLHIRVLVRDGKGSAGMETAPIRDRGSRQMTNAAEQKLYILLDRSYSMWYRERMLFAKVLAIEYLRQKKRGGARLFFRPFDFQVYELTKLTDAADFDRLMRQLLFVEPGGKGTDITQAISVAAQDIRFDGMFEGAEILLITDGMDAIDAAQIKEMLGDKTKLHMLKIGREATEPQPSEIKDLIDKDRSVAGLTREQIAEFYKHKIESAWSEVTETLIETDDLQDRNLAVGEDEIQFALRAVEKLAAADPQNMSLAEAENAFRKASFLEGFVEFLIDHAADSPTVAGRKGDLENALSRLHGYKLRIAAKSGITANLLAAKDVRFVTDKALRKQAKKGKMSMEDLGRVQESADLMLKFKLAAAQPPAGEGEGITFWQLLGMVAKSAARSVTGWLFAGGKEETAESTPPEPNPDGTPEGDEDDEPAEQKGKK